MARYIYKPFGVAISVALLTACGVENRQGGENAALDGEYAGEPSEVLAAANEPTGTTPERPPRISIDPPTSEAKPPGWDAGSCPSGQTAIVGTAGIDLLTSSTSPPLSG